MHTNISDFYYRLQVAHHESTVTIKRACMYHSNYKQTAGLFHPQIQNVNQSFEITRLRFNY